MVFIKILIQQSQTMGWVLKMYCLTLKLEVLCQTGHSVQHQTNPLSNNASLYSFCNFAQYLQHKTSSLCLAALVSSFTEYILHPIIYQHYRRSSTAMQYLHCPHICHREIFQAGKIGLCQSWQSASLWSGGLQIGQAEVLMACLRLSRLTFQSEPLAFVFLESRLWHFIYHFKPLIGKREREEFIYLFRQMNIAYWSASWMNSFVSVWLVKMLAFLMCVFLKKVFQDWL